MAKFVDKRDYYLLTIGLVRVRIFSGVLDSGHMLRGYRLGAGYQQLFKNGMQDSKFGAVLRFRNHLIWGCREFSVTGTAIRCFG